MLKIDIRYLLLIGVIFYFFINQTYAQSSISSPYSAFGLGNLVEANNIRNKSMGGLSTGMRDYFTVNFKNPASYTAFDSTSFIFEGGVLGQYVNLKTTEISEEYSSSSMNNLLFGFPVTKWWKSSLGLIPFSQVGYNVNDYDVKENIGTIKYTFEGEGGISEFYWGNAFRLGENLSVGLNASFIFGTLDKTQKVNFPDSAFILSTKTNNSYSVNDIKFDIGAQYHTKIGNENILVIGATYRPQQNLSATRSKLVRSFLGENYGIDNDTDTVSFIDDEKGSIIFPGGFGVGFSFGKGYSWLFGLEYNFDQWENFRNFNLSDTLANSHVFKAGGHYIPDANSFSYFKRVDYRLGAHYTTSNLILHDEQLNGFGITFGIGLPVRSVSVRGSRSMVNIGFEFGRRGTLNNGLIKENYYNVYVGISIFERWFFKRRYK